MFRASCSAAARRSGGGPARGRARRRPGSAGRRRPGRRRGPSAASGAAAGPFRASARARLGGGAGRPRTGSPGWRAISASRADGPSRRSRPAPRRESGRTPSEAKPRSSWRLEQASSRSGVTRNRTSGKLSRLGASWSRRSSGPTRKTGMPAVRGSALRLPRRSGSRQGSLTKFGSIAISSTSADSAASGEPLGAGRGDLGVVAEPPEEAGDLARPARRCRRSPRPGGRPGRRRTGPGSGPPGSSRRTAASGRA